MTGDREPEGEQAVPGERWVSVDTAIDLLAHDLEAAVVELTRALIDDTESVLRRGAEQAVRLLEKCLEIATALHSGASTPEQIVARAGDQLLAHMRRTALNDLDAAVQHLLSLATAITKAAVELTAGGDSASARRDPVV